MKRLFALSLIVALAFTLAPVTKTADAEKNPKFNDLLKQYKDLFKTKSSIKQRRKGVSLLAKSKDPRGIKELMKALKKQEKHSGKKRKEWETQEAEWQEKTDRIEKLTEEKRKRARERGEDTISVSGEEAEWLGANGQEGKMHREKRRLQKLYKEVLSEEDFSEYILRGIARILNSLEGEEYDKNVRGVTQAAIKAKARYKPAYVRVLGYTKGDAVTGALEKITKDTDPQIVMMALESIGRQNTERGMKILFRFLEDGRWQIRAAAINGLAFFKRPEVIDQLIVRAEKEEGAVRRRCFGAMSAIVGEKVKGTIEAWKSWWKSNREEWVERWERLPNSGMPVQEDPPVIGVDAEENSGSTSFYGIKTDSKHIIFVVDISGSMRPREDAPEDEKPKIDIARQELINALKTLSAADEDERGAATFNVILFNTYVHTFKEGKMVTATKKNKDKVFKYIEENVVADGMTNIFDALEGAFNIISGSDKKQMAKGADTIFFMTDGAPTRGKFWEPELIVKEITRMNKERKIAIHCIGVGKGHHAGFLQALAANNNGKYISRE
ncbi:MAG: VWA domain-containing protein [Planctomycetota bacterium]|nr:VWA domain-containing protein [Planctomycetota bacterium]